MPRRAITVSGVVQGVGFRPFVHQLASRLGLQGFVRNDSDGVIIEIEGQTVALDRFLAELTIQPPPLARVDRVRWKPQEIQRAACRSWRGPGFAGSGMDRDAATQCFLSARQHDG
jgi:hydrogenase maturation protein HypF